MFQETGSIARAFSSLRRHTLSTSFTLNSPSTVFLLDQAILFSPLHTTSFPNSPKSGGPQNTLTPKSHCTTIPHTFAPYTNIHLCAIFFSLLGKLPLCLHHNFVSLSSLLSLSWAPSSFQRTTATGCGKQTDCLFYNSTNGIWRWIKLRTTMRRFGMPCRCVAYYYYSKNWI